MKEIIFNKKSGPVILLVIDGWGIAPKGKNNIISLSEMPFFNNLLEKYPFTVLDVPNKNKEINLQDNYSILGKGSLDQKDKKSLFDFFEDKKFRSSIITDIEKYSYCNYFFDSENKQNRKNVDIELLNNQDKIKKYILEIDLNINNFLKEILKSTKTRKYKFILGSISSLDMIARTGNIEATMAVLSQIDLIFKKITKLILDIKGTLIITSCAGNAEEIDNIKNRYYTTNGIPFVLINNDFEGKKFKSEENSVKDLSLITPYASLYNVFPTILKLFDIEYENKRIKDSLI